MKLQKAIDKLQDLTRYGYPPETDEAIDALKLGQEALKRVREYRPDMGGNDSELLPGETKD
ncbi:unnamed protein product [marine sediment metagenome]|uniref:Uncharacterized protein n=1 Tax=marine sediment metagenome TaxID=412755 RepID=X1LJT6_9ZZZZ